MRFPPLHLFVSFRHTLYPDHTQKDALPAIALCREKQKELTETYLPNKLDFKLNGHTFADLAAIYEIRKASSNSDHAWDEEIQLINHHPGYAPAELIAFRDDIYDYLISHGFSAEDAWKGMDSVMQPSAMSCWPSAQE